MMTDLRSYDQYDYSTWNKIYIKNIGVKLQ